MVLKVNDLIPFASGLAHLGVDGGTVDGQFAMPPVPFGNVHHISGVYHDPLLGNSGIIRFAPDIPNFELSVDGGKSFESLELTDPGLQEGYENSANLLTVFLEEKFGDIEILANNNKWRMANTSISPPIRFSGLIPIHNTRQTVGDLTFLTHPITSGTPVPAPEQQGLVDANALGLPSLILDTGSGLASLAVGSGVAQFFDTTGGSLYTLTSGLQMFFNQIDFADVNYKRADSSLIGEPRNGIKVFSDGLYRISYTLTFEKTGGTNRAGVTAFATRNIHETIRHSRSYTYCRSTTIAFGSAHKVFYIELMAGDMININATATAAVVPGVDIVSAVVDECWITLQWLGPKRFEQEQEILT